ncbi:MAG: DUF3515 family protein [Leucobacter sp.]
MKSLGIRALSGSAALIAAASLITGCAGDVPMHAAENANDPACADVIVHLPDQVAGLDRRTTNAQSTGAWGDPAAVQLQCGIEPSGPTTDSCVEIDGVDWIADDSAAPILRFEAYGRSPGLVVFVDTDKASGTSAIVDLGAVAQLLPQERRCTSLSDAFDVE